ncbi:nucleotidyltransferase domain-containing protein [Candidatus Pacearchaeota archaeon]|nr:nucleotidyltransferase domain-containing protein [Candidatus Pacearchaeota archaeon]
MTLLKFIKLQEARLLFGKRELEIIEKQLLGRKLIPSETTRLSRDIRKKLKAIENISKYKNEFSLKKNQEIKKIIEETKKIILENFESEVSEIILFGSHARKTNINSSDIDICIKLKKTKLNPTKIRARLLGETREGVDIQIFSSLPKKIQNEIDKEGKIIFKK